jgi:D-lactate dehydrogenase
VAEQSVALLLVLVRHLPEAHDRVRAGNFSIDGLMGNDLHGKTVGVVGTGRIGWAFACIMLGFGCTLLGYDIQPNPKILDAGVKYVSLDQLLRQSDVISLHCPLPQTDYLINDRTLTLLKSNALILNTGRG